MTSLTDLNSRLFERARCVIPAGVNSPVRAFKAVGGTPRMLAESFTTAEADMLARAVTEARVDADRMLLATASAFAADGDLLDATQRAEIEERMRDLQAARSLSDAAAIEAKTKALAEGTEVFAAMRMNRGIQKALSGKHIASI